LIDEVVYTHKYYEGFFGRRRLEAEKRIQRGPVKTPFSGAV
jgi:hypothetical protein